MVRFHPTRAGLLVSALLVMCAALPSVASAQDGSCRGSAVRAPENEPVVANPPATPCITDAASAATAPVTAGLTVTNPKASTLRAPGVFAADASVDGATFGGAVLVTVGVVEVSSVASCSGGANVSTGTSSVTGLMVAGQPVAIPAGQALDQQFGTVRVRANQIADGTSRGLIIDSGDQQTVIGEATATGDACATLGSGGGPGGSGGPGGPGGSGGGICAQGSTYEQAGNRCVIRDGSSVIVVSSAYQGPTGGSVISLTAARALVASGQLTGSRCLSGAGPRWVLLGTKAANKLKGTRKADRILALAGKDRVVAGRGNDCADGAKGNDRLTGGAGKDRLVGGAGNDRLLGGAGNDWLFGAAGRDKLSGAGGKDRLDGGRGNDGIRGAKGRDRLYGRGGNDRLRSGPGRDLVRPGSGRNRVS